MNNLQITRSLFIRSVQISAVFISLGLMYFFGVEEKTVLEKSLGFFSGGLLGGLTGLLVFLFIGTIGWVAGAFYGAIGLFSLIVGGLLGGLGLGSIVDVIRSPRDYNFTTSVMVTGLVIMVMFWLRAEKYAGKYYDDHYEGIRKRARALLRKITSNSSEDA